MHRCAVLTLALLGFTTAAVAQEAAPLRPPGFFAGGGVIIAKPTGEFADYVDVGYGLAGQALFLPNPDGIFGLRVDGAFIIYGSETNRYQLVPLVNVDVTTTNQIAAFQFGPQLTLGTGSVQGYGYGQLGFSYFATTSSVEGSGNVQPFANTTNFDDLTFATSGGGGLRIRLSSGWTPVHLDLGLRYMRNGRARYLREGSIEITGNTATITPVESETNLVLIHLGVTVGIRGARRP
ncbi:MAG: hypothetical protein KJZ47_04985 [Gemmatimonadales bacterium]|nr:hypothetical protein [Gemmatimonadales bacterium]